jgi:hypothetical protein
LVRRSCLLRPASALSQVPKVSAKASSLVAMRLTGYLGSSMSGSRSQVRTVLRDSPVCRHISLIDSLSRYYKRLILAKVRTLITPASPVHNLDHFERTALLTRVKFGRKLFLQRGQFWVAFNIHGFAFDCE